MKKKTFLLVITIFSISLLTIFILVVDYYRNQPKAGGFTRILKPSMITLKDSMDIGYFHYVAGLTSENIYLGHSQRVNYLLKFSYDLKDTTTFKLEVPYDWKRLELRVDSPYVYAMDGTVPGVLYSKLSSLEMQKTELANIYFSKSILLSPYSLIFKAYDGTQQQEVLTKRVAGAPANTNHSGILERQNGDGLFSLSGQLEFEPKSKRLLYMYFYRNTFISLDTGLNILYKGNTIDTISTAKIELVKVNSIDKSTDTYTPSKPPFLVNRRCRLTPDFIFVNSALNADNEDKQVFKQSSVIDVYALKTGEYKFSFYLPNFHKQKLSDFMIHNNTLVAVFANSICTYKLNLVDMAKTVK